MMMSQIYSNNGLNSFVKSEFNNCMLYLLVGLIVLVNLKIKNIAFILLGAAIFTFGIVHFNMLKNLSEGGFTGVTLLLYFLSGWDPYITFMVLNVSIFLFGLN